VVDNAKLLRDAAPGERDENVDYYLAKLDELHGKFSAFIPSDALSSSGSESQGRVQGELGLF
jgi:hypothetical protein